MSGDFLNPKAIPLSPHDAELADNDQFEYKIPKVKCPKCGKFYGGFRSGGLLCAGGQWFLATYIERPHNKCAENGDHEKWFAEDGTLIYDFWD